MAVYSGACAGVGSVIGAVTISEHWRDLPLESLRDTARP